MYGQSILSGKLYSYFEILPIHWKVRCNTKLKLYELFHIKFVNILKCPQWPLLLTWINFNASIDK